MKVLDWLKEKWKVIVSVLAIILVSLFAGVTVNNFITGAETPDDDPDLVVFLSFDNVSNCGQDDSGITGDWDSNGIASCIVNRDICKWYGCANLTANDGSDYFNSTNNFDLEDNMTVSYWVYSIVAPAGSPAQGFWEMSEGDHNSDPNYKHGAEGAYGQVDQWYTLDIKIDESQGESKASGANHWTHYCSQYNGVTFKQYKNGVLNTNASNAGGNLNYSAGEVMSVGKNQYGQDLEGYMDEFKVYNSSDIDCVALYNTKALGTPPELDVFVQNISYILHINWSHENNSLIDGEMPINITIKNQGTNATDYFNVSFVLNDVILETWNISLSAESSQLLEYTWTTSRAFHLGEIRVDTNDEVNEEDETNNNQTVFIPFMDRPWYWFNLTEWYDTLLPKMQNASYKVANDDYNWMTSFGGSSFNDHSANSVDSYGKKALEVALTCLSNDYTEPDYPTKQQCTLAMNHFEGWSNRSADGYSEYTDVQGIHGLAEVGIAFDIMFPNMTKVQYDRWTPRFYDICQSITNLDNVRPDLDEDDAISGGNGKGFGSGMGGFCYTLIGSYAPNPTLIQETPQSYYGESLVDGWMDREISYLKGFKNDSYAKYQEGALYKWYSQFHLVQNFLFEDRFGLNNLDEYQNALCSMGREVTSDYLDSTYNGQTLRNDENRYFRFIQRGDSNSYEDPGSGSLNKFAQLSFYGTFCDDVNVKKQLLFIRNLSNANDDDNLAYLDAIMYPKVLDGVDNIPDSIDNISEKFRFDNANDIATLRRNFSYVNDDVIQVDGGEEKGGGHSHAQGWYGYFFGEPFFDYEQVSNEDRNYGEDYKNAIAFQTSDGGGHYSATCGNAEYNQYYGMSDCPQLGTYPDYRDMPLSLTGDLEDYNAKSDASYMAVKKWMPYAPNNGTVTEDFVVWDDMLVRSITVENSNTGNIFDNHIYILEEFNITSIETNYTIQREGAEKYVDVNLIYSNVSTNLTVENSTEQYTFTKTGLPTGLGYYGRVFLNISATDARFIRAYNWYNSTPVSMTQIGSADYGVAQGDHNIVFDTDADNNVNISTHGTDGWALGYDTTAKEYFTNNATILTISGSNLWTSNKSTAIFTTINTTQYTLNVNTMERANYIDTSRDVHVTFNISQLTNTSGSYVQKSGINVSSTVSGDLINFTMSSDQNGDNYIIYGAESDDACVPADYGTNQTKISCDFTSCVFVGSSCTDNRVRYNNITTCNFASCS